MYVNGTAASEVYRIKFATVADYEWNTSAYVPELSLWKALVKAYGVSAAKEALFFSEAYYGLYEVCMRMERAAGVQEAFDRQGGAWLTRIDQALSALRQHLPAGDDLIRELEAHRDRLKQRFEVLARGNSSSN
jgi:hypothetical protein